MSSATTLPKTDVRWDLSALFSGMDDPKIEATWSDAKARAQAFAEQFRSRIAGGDLDPDTLFAAITEYEAILQESHKPAGYANLVFATDSDNPAVGAFLQKQMENGTELRVLLMFFELELQKTPATTIERCLADPRLAPYRHYVENVRVYTPYTLSEPEEVILEETSNTGRRAWVRLFEELTGNHVFRTRNPATGETENKTQQEVLSMLRDANRSVRQAAADALSEGLAELEKVIVFTYNTVLQDQSVGDRLRKHDYPEHSRHLANELDKATVDLVVSMCGANHDLVARYYRVKREILGLPELTHVDRYAPLFEAEGEIGFEAAREIVLQAFGEFSAELRARASDFFENNWIDAAPKTGKLGGAFCSYNTPDTHPVVFLTYLNKMQDVGTLAHELGHGVHGSLSRAQSLLNFHGSLPLAELASIFGEMLVFEKLVAQASAKDKLALYAEKIEGMFASVFRQASMFRFEQRCHEARRSEGELTAERFGAIWQEELQAMFGDSVTLGDQHRRWWSYVGHFFFAPFYVYAYAFGELLTLSLYQKAKAEGPAFEATYVELLRLGGSKTPKELMAGVGVDLASRDFWQGGFDAMERLIAEFEALWAAHA
ncbi:MAG: M3 family oligoendopeptidase [Fimbriimonadaceae bacterium]|nr:M3 family oligoendopeptidase [Fimbriimonadaceae bacterium]